MKKPLRVLLSTVVVIAIAAAIAAAAVQRYVTALAPRMLREATGLDLKFDRVTVCPFRLLVSIRGIEVPNPQDFPKGAALRISEVSARVHPATLWSDEIRLRDVNVVFDRIIVIRNERGRLNLEAMVEESKAATKANRAAAKAAATNTTAKAGSAAPKAKAQDRPVRMDVLTVKARDAEYFDYTELKEGQPSHRTFVVSFERSETNVTDPKATGQKLLEDLAIELAPKVFISQKNLDKAAKELGITPEQAEAGVKALIEGLAGALKKKDKKKDKGTNAPPAEPEQP